MKDKDPPANDEKSLKAAFADSMALATRFDRFLDDLRVPRLSPRFKDAAIGANAAAMTPIVWPARILAIR